MQRQLQHKTIFVAALSVYLGLLIVGAPPHVLAQQSSQASNSSSKPTEDLSPNEKASFDSFYRLVSVINKTPDNEIETHFSFASEIVNGKAVNFRVLASEGNAEIIKLLREINAESNFKTLESLENSSDIRSLETDYKINFSGITVKSTLTFENTGKASTFADTLELLYGNAKVREAEKKPSKPATTEEFSARSVNNQVFIVTRLPRAGLDSLLKANEKAN